MEIPIQFRPPPGNRYYTITLRPGEVWYFEIIDFVRGNVDDLINKIANSSDDPKIRSPRPRIISSGCKDPVEYDCAELDELLNDFAWEDRLRIYHALDGLVVTVGMSQWIYCQFHRHLRLGRDFAPAECAEAWIKHGNFERDLRLSYISSPRHLVFRRESTGRYEVFNKTPFVQSRLNAMAEEDRLKAESEEAQRGAALAEQLRRSRFTTFVYLMEDPRNGAFKIGRSQTPGIRERTLQSEVPEILLRFSIPADETHEKELHALFQHRRIRGEWFGLTKQELLAVIAFLKENGDAERASGDFEWLGRLYLSAPPGR